MSSTRSDIVLHSRGARRDAVVTGVAFMLLLFVPLAMIGLEFGRDEQIMRDWEFRLPSPRPAFPLKKTDIVAFPWRWDAFWSDAFPYRSPLIHSHAFVRYQLMSANPANKIFLDDGFVFDLGAINQYRGKTILKEDDLDEFLQILRSKREYFGKIGVAYYFVLSPSRVDFQRDVVPAAFQLPDRNVWSVQIQEQLSPDMQEYFIMPDAVMRAAKERWPDRPLYYRRDGHWNQWGRVVAASAIIQSMQKAFPTLPVLDPAVVSVVNTQEDQAFWGDVRMLGVAFHVLPPVTTTMVAPVWSNQYQRLAADTNRSPLSLVYTSDSFMEILSDRSPEILSFGKVTWLGLSQFNRLNSPENCLEALKLQPDVVLEGKALGAFNITDYLRTNSAWLTMAVTH